MAILGALQFLGNLFEYFLVRKNHGKEGKGEVIRAAVGSFQMETTLA